MADVNFEMIERKALIEGSEIYSRGLAFDYKVDDRSVNNRCCIIHFCSAISNVPG